MERWTTDKAEEVLCRWRASGQTARAYGREEGIDPQRLFYWQRRLGKGRGKRGAGRPERGIARLVPAVVQLGGNSMVGGEYAVVVRLPGGLTVEADAARVAAEWLAALVSELGRR